MLLNLFLSSFVKTEKETPKTIEKQNEKQTKVNRFQLSEIKKQNIQGNDSKSFTTESGMNLPKFSLKTTKSASSPKYIPKFSPLFSTASVTSKTTTTARERPSRSFQTLKTTVESLGKSSQKFSPIFSTTRSSSSRKNKSISKNTDKSVPDLKKKTSPHYTLHTFKANLASNLLTQSRIEFTTKKSELIRNWPNHKKESRRQETELKSKLTTWTSEKPISTTVTQPNASAASDEELFDEQLAMEASDATYNCLKEMTLNYKLSPDKMQELFSIGRRYNRDTKMIACLVLGNTYRSGLATLKESYAMRPRHTSWIQFEAGYLVYDMSLKYQSLIELYYLVYTKMLQDKAPIRYMFYIYRLMTSLGTLITHFYNMLSFMKIKHYPDQVPYEGIANLNIYNNQIYKNNFKEKIDYKNLIFAEIDKQMKMPYTNSSELSPEELERIKKIKDLMEKMEMDKKRRIQKLKELHSKLNTPASYPREPTRY